MADLNLTFEQAVREWTEGRLCPSSGYYAGRGPMTCDLNDTHLEALWEGLKKQFPDTDAAANFVRMVNDLDDMSASAFLVSFQAFFYGGFKRLTRKQQPGDQFQLSGRDRQLEAEGFGCIFSALGRSNRNPALERMESDNIKTSFIVRHINEISPEERKERPRTFLSFNDYLRH